MNNPARRAAFYFVQNYQSKGARVILLVGPRWTDPMRRHYGISTPPFYVRRAHTAEPDTDSSGHPFGWVYTPTEMLAEEERWSSDECIAHITLLLQRLLAQPTSEGKQQ